MGFLQKKTNEGFLRKKDIEENRIMTHQEAKEKIKNHIKNKAF